MPIKEVQTPPWYKSRRWILVNLAGVVFGLALAWYLMNHHWSPMMVKLQAEIVEDSEPAYQLCAFGFYRPIVAPIISYIVVRFKSAHTDGFHSQITLKPNESGKITFVECSGASCDGELNEPMLATWMQMNELPTQQSLEIFDHIREVSRSGLIVLPEDSHVYEKSWYDFQYESDANPISCEDAFATVTGPNG